MDYGEEHLRENVRTKPARRKALLSSARKIFSGVCSGLRSQNTRIFYNIKCTTPST